MRLIPFRARARLFFRWQDMEKAYTCMRYAFRKLSQYFDARSRAHPIAGTAPGERSDSQRLT